MKVCGKAKQAQDPTDSQNASVLRSATAPIFESTFAQVQKLEFCLTKTRCWRQSPLFGQITTWAPNHSATWKETLLNIPFFFFPLVLSQIGSSNTLSSVGTWRWTFLNWYSFSIQTLGNIAIQPKHLAKTGFGARVTNASCEFSAKKKIRWLQGMT